MTQPANRIRYALPLIMLSSVMTGCFESAGSRFTDKPNAAASSVTFVDTDQTDAIGGRLTITPPTNEVSPDGKWTFDYYVLRWAQDGVPMQRTEDWGGTDIGFIQWAPRMDGPTQMDLYSLTPVEGANGIAVIAANALGAADGNVVVSVENLYVNPNVPKVMPTALAFADWTDQVNIQGHLRFTPANDPQFPITHYMVRFADAQGCPLKLHEVARINQSSSQIYQLIQAYPPPAAHNLVVIPANSFGEAYLADCSYPHLNVVAANVIKRTELPYFQASSIVIGADQDETDTYSGTITINPSQDERDLSTGYYVDIISKSGSYSVGGNPAAYFPANGGPHYFQAEKIDPDLSVIMISTGRRHFMVTDTHEYKIDVANHNTSGTWRTIRNADKDTCIKTVDQTRLTLVACDRYDASQRFFVTNVQSPDDTDTNSTNKDHYYTIESAQYRGRYMHRPYTGTGTPELWGTGSSDWKSRFLLKSFQAGEVNENAVEKSWKKMAVVNKVDIIYHFACASVLAVNDTGIDMPWSNCSGIPTTSFGLMTNHIEWKFEDPNGNVDYLNDKP